MKSLGPSNDDISEDEWRKAEALRYHALYMREWSKLHRDTLLPRKRDERARNAVRYRIRAREWRLKNIEYAQAYDVLRYCDPRRQRYVLAKSHRQYWADKNRILLERHKHRDRLNDSDWDRVKQLTVEK